MTTDAISAATSEVVARVLAVDLDFPSAHVRLSGSSTSIFVGGEEFLGVGQLGSITAVEESVELKSYGIQLRLSGIPRDAMLSALSEAYQGRRATVWEVLLNPSTMQAIADPIVTFRGRMDQMNGTFGREAVVSLSLENRLRDWERPRLSRYTTEDQRRTFPDDLGFAYVSTTTEKEVTWPAKSFRG
ncbi:hypothetical protein [Pseudoroseomonas cervicalis]|uniref:hypothetical protein n=1 Tax=Teichococcus cervicalis TaxID=204525 RepID=UPI0027D89223|nr:hypothetical protein [Pseudoroseomonas cervicalis]